jgi:hypothetical protein
VFRDTGRARNYDMMARARGSEIPGGLQRRQGWDILRHVGLCYAYATPDDATPDTYWYKYDENTQLYKTSIVHLSYIHKLPPSPPCNLVRYPLLHHCVVCGLDSVHLVPGPWHTCCEIVDTSCSSHFEDEMLAAETKSYDP